MACVSTLLGINLDCDSNVGGLSALYIVPTSDVSVIALGVDGEISGVTMVSGKTFKTYSFKRGNAQFTSTGTHDEKAGTNFYTTELTVSFNKQEKLKRKEMLELSKGQTYMIAKDYNGIYHFIGYGSYVSGSVVGASGSEMGDANNYSLTMTSMSAELPNTVLSTIIAAIIS